ncbi:MAG TPA: glycerol-3-phosphate acyltransferase, partial [Petrotogaceae bacterium]|nr:glycerol-3-phosphate acyltransferase [Petrotogaceae bacterium]
FFFAVWIPATLITQYVSIASLLALGVDVLIGFIYNYKLGLYGFLLLLLAVYRHRENIKRLLKGQENKTDLVKIFSGKLKK